MFKWITLALMQALLCTLISASMAQADELGEREKIYEAVSGGLKRGDFATLDQLADLERSDQALGSAGAPLLGEFYRYVEGNASVYAPNKVCGASEQKMSEDWLKARPQSAAAQIIYADSLIKLAFCARGGDVAYKVPKTAWPIFNRYIEQAANYLQAHKEASYVDPEWFSAMEAVANAQGWNSNDFMSLLRRGAGQHPLYYRIWYGGMIYYSPRWNGSNEDTESFVRFAVSETKSLIGPDIYARLYRWAANVCCIKNLKTDTGIDWDYMKYSARSVINRYPDPSNLVGYAILLCKAKDYDELDFYIDKMFPYGRADFAWKTASRKGACDSLAYMESPVYPDSRSKLTTPAQR